jgi:hypothetical protein
VVLQGNIVGRGTQTDIRASGGDATVAGNVAPA